MAAAVGGAAAAGTGQVATELFNWIAMREPVTFRSSAKHVAIATFAGFVTGGILVKIQKFLPSQQIVGVQLTGAPGGIVQDTVILKTNNIITLTTFTTGLARSILDGLDSYLNGYVVDSTGAIIQQEAQQ